MSVFDLPRPFMMTCLFVLGCCFGSFLNVCIHRFPSRNRLRDQLHALNSHRSGCPRCAASIQWRDNIPLLGWLMLRGRCRNCRKPISVRYPLVELLTGVLFVAVYWSEMPTLSLWAIESSGLYDVGGPQTIRTMFDPPLWLHARYALHMAMICGLIAATFIDFEFRIIPDGCTVPVMIAAVCTAGAIGQVHIVPLWFQDASVVNVFRPAMPGWLQPLIFYWDCVPFAAEYPRVHALLVSLVGLIVGGGVVWVVRIIGSHVLRQEAMGFGDVVLMAMVGSVLGWQPALAAFFLAPLLAVSAAVVSWLTGRGNVIPYGPWLSLASVLLLLTWPHSWPLARRVFDMGPLMVPIAVFLAASLFVSLQLVQIIKRLLGIPLYADQPSAEPEWTSADHLTFYNGERPDEQTGLWRRPEWPGSRAGRGLSGSHHWRHGSHD